MSVSGLTTNDEEVAVSSWVGAGTGSHVLTHSMLGLAQSGIPSTRRVIERGGKLPCKL